MKQVGGRGAGRKRVAPRPLAVRRMARWRRRTAEARGWWGTMGFGALSVGINSASAVSRVFAAELVPEIGTNPAADAVTGSLRRG